MAKGGMNLMSLRSFGEKYPFLKANMIFWEKYIRARDQLFKLLPPMLDISKLEESDFLENMDQGKPFFAYDHVGISGENINILVNSFCRDMDIPQRILSFPERMPLFEDLQVTVDEDGFILAEVHASIASFIESVIAGDEEAINWMEPYCPICGAHAGLGLIDSSGKKNLVCSHCHSGWIYLRTSCGLCGNLEERGNTFLSTDEVPNWMIEVCDACFHYLKVCDMRNSSPDIITYPLLYLTTWELDLVAKEQGYEPALFWVFERAGWLRSSGYTG